MSQLLDCPHCGKQIEDDSAFCDQCGAELYRCPECGKFLKGKFCPSCGVKSVKAGSAAAAPASERQPDQQQPVQQRPVQQQPVQQQPVQQQPVQQQPVQQQPVQQQPVQQQPVQQQPVQQQPIQQGPRYTTDPGNIPHTGTAIPGGAGATPARLSCRSLGIILSLSAGAVIGRVNGNYVAQLSTLSFISGTHGRVDFNGVSWTFTDLGSTNGTTINGIPCQPHTPMPFKTGDMIRIGKTYDFYVE